MSSSPALPPLPKIEGDVDLILDVFTHHSLRFQSAPMNDDYGDTERLAELGHHVLELAVAFHYYNKRPMLTASQIAQHRDQALTSTQLEAWLETYDLRNKLRFAPGSQDAIGTPDEIRRFFNTYVGALHIRNGNAVVQDWISRLIDPDSEPVGPPSSAPIRPEQDVYLAHQPWTRSSPTSQLPLQPPLQPPGSPPPLPPHFPSSPPAGVSMPVSNLVSLALVNQTAVQRGVSLTYSADQTGPAHLPTWTVRCLMNGVEQGIGQGKSQKQAKEEAARQAWVRMGW